MRKSIFVVLLCGLFLAPAHSDTGTSGAAAEKEVLISIRARLDALARDDMKTWSGYVADDMLNPMEAEMPSKMSIIKEREHWPAAVKYYYGPIENPKVRI